MEEKTKNSFVENIKEFFRRDLVQYIVKRGVEFYSNTPQDRGIYTSSNTATAYLSVIELT